MSALNGWCSQVRNSLAVMSRWRHELSGVVARKHGLR
jgi:hypothetical protein